jgi:branched-chain amino acid transport system substrate-binding protein
MTGPVSDQGRPYCLGIFDAIEWFEKNNPLPKGYKVELTWVDYSYKIPEAQAAYDRFKAMGVKFLFLTGTGETAALAPKFTEDKIPALSASYAAELAKKEAQYYFFGQTDYSTHGRAMVQFVVEKMEGDAQRQPATSSKAWSRIPERPLRHGPDTCDQGHGEATRGGALP